MDAAAGEDEDEFQEVELEAAEEEDYALNLDMFDSQ